MNIIMQISPHYLIKPPVHFRVGPLRTRPLGYLESSSISFSMLMEYCEHGELAHAKTHPFSSENANAASFLVWLVDTQS